MSPTSLVTSTTYRVAAKRAADTIEELGLHSDHPITDNQDPEDLREVAEDVREGLAERVKNDG